MSAEPAAEDQRHLRASRPQQTPVERLPRAPAHALARGRLRARVQQVKIDMKTLEVPHVARTGHLSRLDHARSRPARHLRAERRALVAVQLDHARPELLAVAHDPLERRVHVHPAQLDAAAQRRDDLLRRCRRAPPRRALIEDHSERPCAELDRELRVGEVGDAADLDPDGCLIHPSTVARPRAGGPIRPVTAAAAPTPTPRARFGAGEFHCSTTRCTALEAESTALERINLRACWGWAPSSGAGRASPSPFSVRTCRRRWHATGRS